MRVIASFTLMALLALSSCLVEPESLVLAQKSDDATRKLWDTAFIASSNSRRSSKRRSYRVATPNVPVDNVAPDTVVGVTIWRLRPANRSDSGDIPHERAVTGSERSKPGASAVPEPIPHRPGQCPARCVGLERFFLSPIRPPG